MTTKMCKICKVNKAEVPDREVMGVGRPIKRICRQCHRKRLSGDILTLIDTKRKRD